MKVQQIATVSVEEVIQEVFGGGYIEALEEFRNILEENHTSDDTDLALVLVENLRHNLPCYGADWRKFCRKHSHHVLEDGVEATMFAVLSAMLAAAPSGVKLYLEIGQ